MLLFGKGVRMGGCPSLQHKYAFLISCNAHLSCHICLTYLGYVKLTQLLTTKMKDRGC